MNKFKSFIKNKNFQSLTVNFTGAGLGFLNYAIVIRLLSKETFGIWVLSFTVIGIIDFLRSGLLLPSLLKFLPGSDIKLKNKIYGSVWLLGFIITIVIILILLLSGLIIDYSGIFEIKISEYLFWIIFIFISSLPYFITYWKSQSNRFFIKMFVISTLKVGGFTLILLYNYVNPNFLTNPLLSEATHLEYLFKIYFINSSIVSLLCVFLGWSGIIHLKKSSQKIILKLYHFGKYTLGNVVNHSLLKATDTYMIAIFMGANYVAIYDVALSILKIFEVILRSFFANIHPRISEAYNLKKSELFVLLIKKSARQLAVLFFILSIVVIVLGKYLIFILAGDKYEESILILIILVLYSFIIPFNRLINVSLECLGEPKIIFNISIICVLINLLGNYFGILIFQKLWVVAIITVIVTLLNLFLSGYYLKIFSKKIIFKEVSIFKILF